MVTKNLRQWNPELIKVAFKKIIDIQRTWRKNIKQESLTENI